jgi:hypothetical protein
VTANPWPSIAWTAGLIAAIAFLVLVGQHVTDQRAAKRAQAQRDRRTWINQRIAAERDPGRRTAWRTIRDNNQGEQ